MATACSKKKNKIRFFFPMGGSGRRAAHHTKLTPSAIRRADEAALAEAKKTPTTATITPRASKKKSDPSDVAMREKQTRLQGLDGRLTYADPSGILHYVPRSRMQDLARELFPGAIVRGTPIDKLSQSDLANALDVRLRKLSVQGEEGGK